MWPYRYHSVDEPWQRTACQTLCLTFHKANGVSPGRRDMPLTRPDKRRVIRIQGDGNCMFRALSYVVAGTEDHHSSIRAVIIQHMKNLGSSILQHITAHRAYHSVDEYVEQTGMDKDGTWGTDIELHTFAHLTQACVFTYCVQDSNWHRFPPHSVGKGNSPTPIQAKSVYLYHTGNHYNVVGATVKVPAPAVPSSSDAAIII